MDKVLPHLNGNNGRVMGALFQNPTVFEGLP